MAYSSITAELRAEVEGHKREARNARETIARLNRRAQVAEAAVAENLEACQRADVSFSRALANAGYHIVKRERDRLLEALKPFAKARIMMDRESDILFIVYEDGALAAEKYFEAARKVVEGLKSG